MSKCIFKVSSEDPQKPHVKQDVPHIRMEKHAGQNRQQGKLQWERVCMGVGMRQSAMQNRHHPPRNQAEGLGKARRRSPVERALKQKHRHVRRNQEIIEQWRGEPRGVVFQRNHGLSVGRCLRQARFEFPSYGIRRAKIRELLQSLFAPQVDRKPALPDHGREWSMEF